MLRADIERSTALRLAAMPSRQPSIEVVSTHRFQSNFAQGAGKEQADAAAAEDAMIRRYLEKQAQAIEARHRSDLAKIADTNARSVWKSKCYGAFVLNRRVDLHAVDATPARWRGDAGSSPLDRARTAVSSPRNDLVENCPGAPDALVDFHTGVHGRRVGRRCCRF